MRRTAPLALVTTLLLGACADRDPAAPPLAGGDPSPSRMGDERTFTFSTIDVPGSLSTSASGINAAGDIVGAYTDAARRVHGFVLRRGVFTSIDYPDAARTDARGIGPDGEIVGTYTMPKDPGLPFPGVTFHGYALSRDGVFRPVHDDDYLHEIPQRILPDGTILGCVHDTDTMGSMKGAAFGDDGAETITAFASMHNGATPDLRRIAGLYTNQAMMRTEGYIIDDGVFSPLVVPGSSLTAAWDVAPNGEVAGTYRNATGFHGFIRTETGIITVDFPGAAATRVFGINARGDVVGSYVAGGRSFGFLARRTG